MEKIGNIEHKQLQIQAVSSAQWQKERPDTFNVMMKTPGAAGNQTQLRRTVSKSNLTKRFPSLMDRIVKAKFLLENCNVISNFEYFMVAISEKLK